VATTADVTIRCDVPGCREEFEAAGQRSTDDAEDEAREAGWAFITWLAYCPAHAEKTTGGETDGT